MLSHGGMHVRAAPAPHYCIAEKKKRNKSKTTTQTLNKGREEREWVGWGVGVDSRDGARGWGELTEGRQEHVSDPSLPLTRFYYSPTCSETEKGT